MKPANEGDEAGGGAAPPSSRTVGRRTVLAIAVGLIVLTGAGFAIYRDRSQFANTIQRIGVTAALVSFACGLVGVGATFPVWRAVLRGLDVRLPWVSGARVFFTSQLGKYVPGSVWPVVMQMEAARARGASRRTMLSGNLMAIVISSAVGLALACALLPFYDASALRHYWWVLLLLPFVVALLHPRALPAAADRAFALLRRPPLGQRLDVRSEVQAALWALVSWVALGAQLGVLALAVTQGGASTLVLCIAAMALAVPLGVLFIPVPAGAGVRDVVLTLVLTAIMPVGEALAVVVTSRVIVICCDVALAGGAVATDRLWRRYRAAAIEPGERMRAE